MLQFFTKKEKGFTLIEHERSKNVSRNEGFTLIELLVVIAVIGMLSSIVLVSLGPARKKARDAKRQSDMIQISKAMQMYFPDGEKYPETTTAGGTTAPSITPYMTSVPSDPTNTGDQQYKWSKNSGVLSKYCVYTKLEAVAQWVASSEKGTKTDLISAPPTDLTSTTPANCSGTLITTACNLRTTSASCGTIANTGCTWNLAITTAPTCW